MTRLFDAPEQEPQPAAPYNGPTCATCYHCMGRPIGSRLVCELRDVPTCKQSRYAKAGDRACGSYKPRDGERRQLGYYEEKDRDGF